MDDTSATVEQLKKELEILHTTLETAKNQADKPKVGGVAVQFTDGDVRKIERRIRDINALIVEKEVKSADSRMSV